MSGVEITVLADLIADRVLSRLRSEGYSTESVPLQQSQDQQCLVDYVRLSELSGLSVSTLQRAKRRGQLSVAARVGSSLRFDPKTAMQELSNLYNK